MRVPSWNGNETPAQELVAELMHDSGLAVDRWEIDLEEAKAHPHASWEIERASALGVVGRLDGAGAGPTLVLNGHVDVVPPGDERLWTRPPFGGVVEDGRIWGRGALDMKGPLMAGLFALRALRSADVPLAGRVLLHSVIGEEDGGIGTLATILRGHRGDAAIVLEPTAFAVAPLQAGCLNFRVEVPGVAAHGAVREEGVNAIEKLFVVYEALRALERERNEGFDADPLFASYPLPFPISVGTIAGGEWASSVPDRVTMEGRIGVRPDEDGPTAKAALERAVRSAADRDPFLRDHPPTVTWWGGRFLPASTPLDHPLVDALRAATRITSGRETEVTAVPYGADAGLLERVGGMATVLFGAGDIRHTHRPDENVEIESLLTMARALVYAVVGYCGVVERS